MEPQISREQFEIFATGLDHPESCAFDRDGNLWAGGEAGQIYRIEPSGKAETIANVGGFCCGVALAPDDSAVFVCVSGVGVVSVAKNGTHEVFASAAGGSKINAPNHLVFDRANRLYVTDSGNWMKRNGRVLRFGAAGEGAVLAEKLGYANGVALSADEKVMFVVESDTDSVLKFDIGAADAVGAAESYATSVGRFPDGMALDADGNLYVCCYASDEIWRVDKERQLTLVAYDRWGILLGRPTNLAFGGPKFDELFVANVGRVTITRAKIGVRGLRPANLR
ncbi:MAG TPA: SMP-30/gluconolactonase/LRE family protein [Lacipirellulaceae bacterium]|nr:SMP-30/gluconolactonase/LRE family protein [Lacipirellulaceae bacterium]